MRRTIPLMMAILAALALAACGGGKKSSKGGGGGEGDGDAFAELKAIPAQVDAKVKEVTRPVDQVDIMLDQLKVLPKRLDISQEQFSEMINSALAEQEVAIPDSVQGQNREQLEKFLTNFSNFRGDLISTPARAKDLLTELGETSAEIPALATSASTSAAATLANPLASKKEKDAAKKKQDETKKLQADAQARVKAAQGKVGDLPGRATVAINKFVGAARDMGIKENLLRAAKKPVDDAKQGANQAVDTAKEGANQAVKDTTGQ